MKAAQWSRGIVVLAMAGLGACGGSGSGAVDGGGGSAGSSTSGSGTTIMGGGGSTGLSSTGKASGGEPGAAGSTSTPTSSTASGGQSASSTTAGGSSAGGKSGITGGASAGTKGGSASGVASGGASSGKGGTAAGGSSGAAGSTGSSEAKPSAGCGKPAPAASTARQTIDINGTAREYIVVYPTNYDANHPYRAIFEFHGSTGTAEENIRFQWYGMQPLSGNSAIFIAPQGLGSPTGWANSGGQDVAFVKKLVASINETFCVDTSRIFVTGFSYGAMFSNTLGCQMGDVFRAIAPASGGGPNGSCVGKTAAVIIHGSADSTVNISSGEASRDFWLKANHCGTTTKATEPSPCVTYEGCDAGYPVAWCQHTQGHQILSSFFGPAIWNFISQL